MAQSLARIVVHVTFSTKQREPMIASAVRPALSAYIAGALRAMNCAPIAVNSVADHVHILCVLGRTISISALVEGVKKGSSHWMKQHCPTFSWQGGYAAFSVSESLIPKLTAYIARQEEHHRHVSFKDELRRFLERHNVALDESVIWT